MKELRKEKTERETQNEAKDPDELLSEIMMMQRQHIKTKRYDVVIKKRNSNLNCNKVSKTKKDVIHINEIINSKEGKNLKKVIKSHSGKIVGNSLKGNNKNDMKKESIESISIDLAGENASSYHSSKNNNLSLFMQKSPSLKIQHDKIGSNYSSNTPIKKSPISIIKRAKSGIKEKNMCRSIKILILFLMKIIKN